LGYIVWFASFFSFVVIWAIAASRSCFQCYVIKLGSVYLPAYESQNICYSLSRFDYQTLQWDKVLSIVLLSWSSPCFNHASYISTSSAYILAFNLLFQMLGDYLSSRLPSIGNCPAEMYLHFAFILSYFNSVNISIRHICYNRPQSIDQKAQDQTSSLQPPIFEPSSAELKDSEIRTNYGPREMKFSSTDRIARNTILDSNDRSTAELPTSSTSFRLFVAFEKDASSRTTQLGTVKVRPGLGILLYPLLFYISAFISSRGLLPSRRHSSESHLRTGIGIV
jgi:hypothetical protein